MKLYCSENNRSYGFVGTLTGQTDRNGNYLHVGDVVIIKSKKYKWSKMRFVAYDEEHNKFYVMGAYIDDKINSSDYDIEIVVHYNSLTEGFGIGNVYYTK